MNVIPAVKAAFLGDTELTDQLGIWQGAPCVTDRDPIPADMPRPYVWISAALRNKTAGAKVELGRDTMIEVWCVTNNRGNNAPCDAIAERVYTLLRQRFDMDDGSTTYLSDVNPGIKGDSDESVIVRKVTANFKIM